MSEKILVSDQVSEDGIARLVAAGFEVDFNTKLTPDELKACIGQYSGWVVRSASRATADVIANAHKLRVIGRAGVGVDNVDVEAATQKGIVVMNTPGGNTVSTAEHTVSLICALAHRVPDAAGSMREGRWDRKNLMGTEIDGKTLGVVGLGRVGQEVIKRMKGFGVHVIGFDPFVSQERMRQLGIEPAEVDDICRRADFITLHSPLSPETKNLIDTRRLALMKRTAFLINCARGGIADELALAKALNEGVIAGAALDVFELEPLPADHPLRTAKNAILTPHIAASTVEAQENVAIQVAEQVADYLKNGVIRNAVNAPSVEPEVLEEIRPYLILAEKLGAFLSQSADGPITLLEAKYSGDLTQRPTTPLTTAAATGFLAALTDEPVNYVNAFPLMKSRGVEIVETRSTEPSQFRHSMTLTAKQEDGRILIVAGTVFDGNRPRIVLVNDKHFDIVPFGHIVVIENKDVPGIIGHVGTTFGKHGINIAQMTWGRTERDSSAMTVINLDARVSPELIAEIKSLPSILSVRAMNLL